MTSPLRNFVKRASPPKRLKGENSELYYLIHRYNTLFSSSNTILIGTFNNFDKSIIELRKKLSNEGFILEALSGYSARYKYPFLVGPMVLIIPHYELTPIAFLDILQKNETFQLLLNIHKIVPLFLTFQANFISVNDLIQYNMQLQETKKSINWIYIINAINATNIHNVKFFSKILPLHSFSQNR